MFTEFSAGYYVGRLYVEQYDGDRAVMNRDQHEAANKRVYATGKSLERLDHPLVMKIGERYLPVFPADDIPADSLGLPDAVIDETRITNPPTLEDILVAKTERTAQLFKWLTPYSIQAPDTT